MKIIGHEEYHDRVNKLNKNVEIISEYKNSREKIKLKCLVCNTEWKTLPLIIFRSYIHGNGCPKCGLEKAISTKKWNITTEDFKKRLSRSINGKIIILGKYINGKTKIKVKCKKCKRVWKVKPTNLIRGHGCKKCANKSSKLKFRITQKVFKDKIKNINPNIQILGKYVTSKTKIKTKCKICGKVWYPRANGLYRRGCRECQKSKGEEKLVILFDENKIRYERNYWCKKLKGFKKGRLTFDFAIFKNKKLSFLIEFDGKQHFYPIKFMGGIKRFKRQRRCDLIKNTFCIENEIPLIRISYVDYKNIDINFIYALLDKWKEHLNEYFK